MKFGVINHGVDHMPLPNKTQQTIFSLSPFVHRTPFNAQVTNLGTGTGH